MSIWDKVSWFGVNKPNPSTKEIFPIPFLESAFVDIDVENIYSRILTDVFERTHGIKEEAQNLLFDNCLASEVQDGLITMLAKAMATKADLFIVYIPSLKVLRLADKTETEKIKEGYKKKAEPVSIDPGGTGIYISFKNYKKTDMVKFYSKLEYCTVGGLWKQSNLSNAIQLKFKGLRESVATIDSDDAKAQALALADALNGGYSIGIDGDDSVETAKPDLTATKMSIEFIAQKRAYYLGMPASYLLGETSTGLSDSGKADTKSVERGLKSYYFSVAKPAVEALFASDTTFKSEDSEGLSAALEALKTMDATSNEFLSMENKTLVINKAFGLDDDEVGDPPEEPIQGDLNPDGTPKVPVPGQPPPSKPAPQPVPPK